MNNRYTYKAKRKDKPSEWVFGYYYCNRTTNTHYIIKGQLVRSDNEKPINNWDYYEIIPKTLCQWLFNYKDHDYYENDLIEVIGEIDNGLEMYEDRGILTLKLNKEYFNTPALYDEKDNNNLCLEDVFSDEYGLEYNNLGNKFDEVVE